jgi:phosphatidylethanolamine/phosphatidyl-N-methylethanolamine N-methyltransferase
VNVNTNRWNRFRYSLWAPAYDLVGRRFDSKRKESLALLDVRAGEQVLLVGAGTGADLPYLPTGCIAVATDLTPAMLAKARPRLRTGMHLAIMDGHDLAVRAATFDAVVLHLIVAVIPDPVRCLQEVARVLRPGGRAVIFDKFAQSSRPGLLLRLVNVLSGALFTEVTRNLETILDQSGRALVVERDEPALFGGTFRRILLRKPP